MRPGVEKARRVLLIRRKALGDILVTLPAVRHLAQALPEARLDLVVDRAFAPLIQSLAPFCRVIPWSVRDGGRRWFGKLRAQGYDLVIDWLGNPRTALWTAATGASLRVGYDLPRRGWAYNLKVPRNRWQGNALRGFAGEAFLDPLRALGIHVPAWRPLGIRPQFEAGELGSEYLAWRDGHLRSEDPPVALMMSATWPAKAWPARRIQELHHRMRAEGVKALFIPGPGDDDLRRELASDLPEEAFAIDTSLLELADLLGRCRAFVGTDCGPRHLATALGLPTVTVFGPTDAVGWNPADPRHVSLSYPVDCLGCDHTICPRPGRPCLENLEGSTVFAGLQRVLAATEEG